MKPSNEQQNIVNLISTNNIVVDSVAGSGKTTTNLFIAQAYPLSKILLLTYNTKLRLETNKKIKELGIKNMDVFTYHAFCVRHYVDSCKNDQELSHMLKATPFPKQQISYDIIILDESQDITPILYKLICKLNNDNQKGARLCILGDVYQSIYGYNYADKRYITHANSLFKFNNNPWEFKKLTHSYRVTDNMAKFINKCVLHHDRIVATKVGINVKYIICDVFSPVILVELKECLKSYNYDDIFILAPSIKGSENSPLRKLANTLTKYNVPIYMPISDEEKLDEDVIAKKLVFSSFHQAKGLERKVVLVFSFDSSYFKYFQKDAIDTVCPNEIYVAITRASERLIVIHSHKSDYFKFINKNNLIIYTNFVQHKNIEIDNKESNRSISVTEFVRNLPLDVCQKIIDLVTITEINPKETKINIISKSKQNSMFETVSEITGIAILAYYEYITTGKITIYNSKVENFIRDHQKGNNNIRSIISNKEQLDTATLLFLANHYNCYVNKLHYKIYQITKYDWLLQKDLESSINRFSKYISLSAIYEKEYKVDLEILKKELVGRIDIIDNGCVWEIKCVSDLSISHKIQLILYMYMHKHNINKRLQICNIIKNNKKDILVGNYYGYKKQVVTNDKVLFVYKDQSYKTSSGRIYNSGSFKKGDIISTLITIDDIGQVIDIGDNITIISSNDEVLTISLEDIVNENACIMDEIKKYVKIDQDLFNFCNMVINDKDVAKYIENDSYTYKLFNILDNQILEFTATYEDLKKVISILESHKANSSNIVSDDIFINNNLLVYKEYYKKVDNIKA